MNPGELIALLQDFFRDRLALLLRHEESARHVTQYDVNNTYQYVIAREEVHLSWLAAAIQDLGGSVPSNAEAAPRSDALVGLPEAICAEDAARLEQFVLTWRDRVERISHARHKTMLSVILGEALEHRRFFEQAAAGRVDLLGRHADGAESRGAVLPTRWIE